MAGRRLPANDPVEEFIGQITRCEVGVVSARRPGCITQSKFLEA